MVLAIEMGDAKEIEERKKMQVRFGVHLKALREAKDMSAADLARSSDMERSNIARLEGGRSNPSLFVLKKLADGLSVSLEELLKGFK